MHNQSRGCYQTSMKSKKIFLSKVQSVWQDYNDPNQSESAMRELVWIHSRQLIVYLLWGVGGRRWPGLGGVLSGSISILWRVRGEQDRTPSKRRACVLEISEEGVWRGKRQQRNWLKEKEMMWHIHMTNKRDRSFVELTFCLSFLMRKKTVNHPMMYLYICMNVLDGVISLFMKQWKEIERDMSWERGWRTM